MTERWTLRAGITIVILALCAYGMALVGDYVFDDVHSVSGNPAVQDLGNFTKFWTDPGAFSGAAARMYRPALLTSFALNIAISPAAWSLKLGNLLLHAAVAGLLFWWLSRLSRRLRASFVVAAIFAVHPLASEAVNLVSARSELLSTLGVLTALFAHVSWQRRAANFWPLALMILGTVLACGSKETGVVVPGLLLAQSFCLRHRMPNKRESRRAALGIAPVIVLVLVYLAARKMLLGEATVQLLGRAGGDPSSGHGRTLLMQLATMGTLLPRMVWQAVVPTGLSLDPIVVYRDSFADAWVLSGWAMMLGLTVLGLWRGANARLRRLGTVMVWAIALPWIVIPLNMPFAEHRLYGPLVGFAVIAMAAVAPITRVFSRAPRPVMAAVFGLILLLGIVGSASRSWLYQDECKLWQQEIAHNPTSFRAWWGLGTTRMRQADMAGAIAPLQQAHKLYPRHHDTLRNLVEALIALPDEQALPEVALTTAEELLARSPEDPWVRTLKVQAQLQAGRLLEAPGYFVDAEQLALSCLEVAEPKGYVYRLAAQARHGQGDVDGALEHLETSIGRGLDGVDVRLDRARLLYELGRWREAKRAILLLQRECPADPRMLGALVHFSKPPPSPRPKPPK